MEVAMIYGVKFLLEDRHEDMVELGKILRSL